MTSLDQLAPPVTEPVSVLPPEFWRAVEQMQVPARMPDYSERTRRQYVGRHRRTKGGQRNG